MKQLPFSRATKYRTALLDLLKRGTALSVPELQEHLASLGLTPNKTTLYRALEALLEDQVVELIETPDGARSYKLIELQGHHHHAICSSCKQVLDVHLPQVEKALHEAENTLADHYGFTSTNHTINLTGQCRSCIAPSH